MMRTANDSFFRSKDVFVSTYQECRDKGEESEGLRGAYLAGFTDAMETLILLKAQKQVGMAELFNAMDALLLKAKPMHSDS